MRRVIVGEERGAFAVMVAVLLAALLGFGALVIDVGALVQERRELQNGADAAAFAVAQDCAGGISCGLYETTAEEYADLNAVGGASNVWEVCGNGVRLPSCLDSPPLPDGALGYVRVSDRTREASSETDQISFTLARAMGFDGATVRMRATVAWGAPGSATTVPLTISICQFKKSTEDADGVRTYADGPPFTGDPQHVSFHNPTKAEGPCKEGPAGQDNAGGFGWLDSDRNCQVESTADGNHSAKTGAAVPNYCNPAEWLNTTVLIPIYDQVVNPGTKADYHIVGYAAFHLVGYKFPKHMAGEPCTKGESCIAGYFVNYVTSADELGGPDMGATVVTLIE
jgi:hypothetical protein